LDKGRMPRCTGEDFFSWLLKVLGHRRHGNDYLIERNLPSSW